MTKNATAAGKKAASKSGKERKVRTVQSGSVTVKIYEGRNRGKPCFTVIWYIGEKRERRSFFDLHQAKCYAKDRAEKLAAGQVNAPSVTVAQAQDFKEARRRLGPLEVPISVVAGEYADAVGRLGNAGTFRQAVEFFLHNSIRPDKQRTIPQLLEEFLAAKRAKECSQVYLDDCMWRLRRFARNFQVPVSTICTSDIEEWLLKLKVTLTTRRDYQRYIKTLFNFARQRGYSVPLACQLSPQATHECVPPWLHVRLVWCRSRESRFSVRPQPGTPPPIRPVIRISRPR